LGGKGRAEVRSLHKHLSTTNMPLYRVCHDYLTEKESTKEPEVLVRLGVLHFGPFDHLSDDDDGD